jgi:hypothetical protein
MSMVAPPAGTAGGVVVGGVGESWVRAGPADPRGVRVVDVVARAGRVGAGVMLTLDGSTACFVMLVVGGPLVGVVVVVELVVAALVDVVAEAGGRNDCVVQSQR